MTISEDTVIFDKETQFVGRNGLFKSIGLVLTNNGSNIVLQPITSKGQRAHCLISIPRENLAQFIEKLQIV